MRFAGTLVALPNVTLSWAAQGAKGEGSNAEVPAFGSIIALGSKDAQLTIWRVDQERAV